MKNLQYIVQRIAFYGAPYFIKIEWMQALEFKIENESNIVVEARLLVFYQLNGTDCGT